MAPTTFIFSGHENKEKNDLKQVPTLFEFGNSQNKTKSLYLTQKKVMVVSEITLFNTLKSKLGEQEAQIVVEGIKSAVKDEFENKKDVLLTKQDIVEMIEKMNHNKQDLLKWLFGFWLTIMLTIIANLFIKH